MTTVIKEGKVFSGVLVSQQVAAVLGKLSEADCIVSQIEKTRAEILELFTRHWKELTTCLTDTEKHEFKYHFGFEIRFKFENFIDKTSSEGPSEIIEVGHLLAVGKNSEAAKVENGLGDESLIEGAAREFLWNAIYRSAEEGLGKAASMGLVFAGLCDRAEKDAMKREKGANA